MRQGGMQIAALAAARHPGRIGQRCGRRRQRDAPDGSTPLQWAVFNGDIAQAKRLLAASANVKAVNDYGVDAMQLAADASNTELIELLLKAGAESEFRRIRTARRRCTWWRAPAMSRPRNCCCRPGAKVDRARDASAGRRR